MASEASVFVIDSEASVWEALKYLLSDKNPTPDISLDLSKTDWIKFRYTITGEVFHHSVTPAIMSGLVDFQRAFYRSIALILHDDKSIRRLTNSEKDEFELVFTVGKGSSDLIADAGDRLASVARIAVKKMTGRQLMICVLLLIALYFLSPGLTTYVQGNVEIRKQEIQAGKDTSQLDKLTGVINQGNKENHDLVIQALRSSAKAHEIGDQATDGYDSLIKHSERADNICVNGIDISKSAIDELTQISRRTAKDVVITKTYIVKTIDRVDDGYFNIRLESSGSSIIAILNDHVLIAKYMRALQVSLTKTESAQVTLNGRQIGDDIIGAKIMKAFKVK